VELKVIVQNAPEQTGAGFAAIAAAGEGDVIPEITAAMSTIGTSAKRDLRFRLTCCFIILIVPDSA
jgi:hypothetical protein